MRPMKFRAWTGKYMILPELSDWDDFFILPDGDIGYMDEDRGSYSNHRFLGYRKDWEIMQFTGLKDCHEKNVYDGDIVQMQTKEHKKVVVWDEAHLCFILVWLDHFVSGVPYRNGAPPGSTGYTFEKITDSKRIEVIGNIYENQDLLNK